MGPLLFPLLNKPELTALLGPGIRITHVSDVPQNPPIPRVVWSTIVAEPSVYYACPSDQDIEHVQIDVYAKTEAEVRLILSTIRQLIAYNATEQSFGFDYEKDTRLNRASIDYLFFVPTNFRR